MKKFLTTCVISIIVLVVALSAVSCSNTPENAISQAEYNAIKAQLTAAEAKIVELQGQQPVPSTSLNEQVLKDEITSLQAEIEKVGTQIKGLEAQNDTLTKAKTSLETQYAELNTKYTNLLKTTTMTTVTTTPPAEELTEELIENEIFRLINVERANFGSPEFVFGNQIYKLAKQNGKNMSASGKYEYDQSVFYQDIFWGINYVTLESISTAAVRAWTLNRYRFDHGALLNTNKYGAVGVYEFEGVYFITFMAAPYP
jgi:hypothetical protein